MVTACPNCGKQFRVADSAAGKKAKCKNPACGAVFVIAPARGAEPAAGTTTHKSEEKPAPTQARRTPQSVARQKPSGARPGAQSQQRRQAQSQPSAASASPPPPAGPGALQDDLFADLPGPNLTAAASAAEPVAQSPLTPVRRSRWRSRYGRRNWKPIALIAGAVAAAAALVLLVVVVVKSPAPRGQLLGDGGGDGGILPTWAAWCVPENAKGITSADIDQLRELREGEWGQVARNLGQLPLPSPAFDLLPEAMQHEAFDQFAGAISQQGNLVGALHAKTETTLEQMATKLGFSFEDPVQHAGFTYVPIPGGFFAQIDSLVFCFAEDETELKAALARAAKKSHLPLPEELVKAAEYAEGSQRVAVLSPASLKRKLMPQPVPGNFRPEWMAVGLSVGQSMRMKLTAQLPSAEEAEKLADQMQPLKDAAKELEQRLGNMPGELGELATEMIEVGNRVMTGLSASSSGKQLTMSISISISDMKKLVELQNKAQQLRAQQMQNLFGR